MLFPQFASARLESVEIEDDVVVLTVASVLPGAACPHCGTASGRTRGGYRRMLADLPIAGRRIRLDVDIRRFRCDDPGCRAKSFAEQIPGLTAPFARRTALLSERLSAIGLALAGRAGSRLAATLGMPAGRDTLLRLIRALPEPQFAVPAVIGVDDFALRKGAVYGTVIINMETHKPIDVFAGRDADTLAQWLSAHSGIKIICRDRAGSYADGCRQGAPDAIQIADRWHLWKNLGDAVEKTVQAHRACLPEPDVHQGEDEKPTSAPPQDPPGQVAPGPPEPVPESRMAQRFRERHAAVHGLLNRGYSLNAVSRELDLCFRTVQRFAKVADADEASAAAASYRASSLDRFKPYLHQRWNEGVTNASALHRELQALGWRGSQQTVHRYAAGLRTRLRARAAPLSTAPVTPKPRRVAGWIMSDPEHLSSDSAVTLHGILARCPELEAARQHVGAFANMIQNLGGDQLPTWIEHVQADDLPAIYAFATGLRRDDAAVTAGLTLPWSNGPTEGNVNRIKMLKRQTFGRAKLDLLRLRILLA